MCTLPMKPLPMTAAPMSLMRLMRASLGGVDHDRRNV
jgi:hypothetical protein